MSQLSAYHLRRPRLTSRLLGASASVVVGGAGYGKSALAVESAELLDVPVIATSLESAGVSAALLPHRLRSAAARVELSDLAVLMDQAAPAGPPICFTLALTMASTKSDLLDCGKIRIVRNTNRWRKLPSQQQLRNRFRYLPDTIGCRSAHLQKPSKQ